MSGDVDNTESSRISEWRSILTLVVFIICNLIVACPFRLPIYLPSWLCSVPYDGLIALRILEPRSDETLKYERSTPWVRLRLPLNLMTAPSIGVVFLLSTTAIGRTQMIEGTVGANNISTLDILAFAFSVGYITSSIDATGILRYLCVRVLVKYGDKGRWMFCYLYFALFLIGLLFGNDPVIQMGMLFITYMIKLSPDIKYPGAWLFTQFAVANIASTILVSSSTTNIVISQAFKIGFAEYTANVVVPIITTVIVLPPFLLFVLFVAQGLIPVSIKIHEPPSAIRDKGKPFNPVLHDYIRTGTGMSRVGSETKEGIRLMMLAEVLNPFLDKGSAVVGFAIMFMTLIALLALTAKGMNGIPAFWITLPASALMLCWDLARGWMNREETRQIVRYGREHWAMTVLEDEREARERVKSFQRSVKTGPTTVCDPEIGEQVIDGGFGNAHEGPSQVSPRPSSTPTEGSPRGQDEAQTRPRSLDGAGLGWAIQEGPANAEQTVDCMWIVPARAGSPPPYVSPESFESSTDDSDMEESGETVDQKSTASQELAEAKEPPSWQSQVPLPMVTLSLPETKVSEPPIILFLDHSDRTDTIKQSRTAVRADVPAYDMPRATVTSLLTGLLRWLQQTFPTASAVFPYLPFRLIPFALPTFILVQALVSAGWVAVLARGWDTWASKTGTIGAIGGMGFLSVVLCNCAGTNIGTTVLLSRMLQEWPGIHASRTGALISERTHWASVYSLAIGANYGAFSSTFAASLGGLGWQEVLERRGIHVGKL